MKSEISDEQQDDVSLSMEAFTTEQLKKEIDRRNKAEVKDLTKEIDNLTYLMNVAQLKLKAIKEKQVK